MQINLSQKLKHKKWYPWLILGLSGLYMMYKYILQIYPSVMPDQLMSEFHIGASGLGNLAASFFYSYLVVQLFVGVLIDKYGMKLMIPAAIFLGALGAALFAFSNTVWFADLDRALMGIAAAFATVCYLKNVAVWFPPEKFAFLAGLITLSVMFGAIFGEAPLAVVIHYEGWRNAVLVCSILGLFIGFAFFLFITDKHPQTTNQHRIKSEVNLKNIKAIFKSKQNWFVMLYSGLAFAPLAVFGGLWGNPFLMSAYHFSIIQAAKLISIAFIGFALGGPLLGFLSDHYRKRIPLMLAGVALSLVTILLTIYANHISYSICSITALGGIFEGVKCWQAL